jgi:hypothetical protein
MCEQDLRVQVGRVGQRAQAVGSLFKQGCDVHKKGGL